MTLNASSVGGPLSDAEWSEIEAICERAIIRGTTPEDVDDVLDLLPRIFVELRALRAPVADVAVFMSQKRDEIEAAMRKTALGGGMAPILVTALADMIVEHLRPHVQRAAVLARERVSAEQRAQEAITAAESYERLYADKCAENAVLAREAEGLRARASLFEALAESNALDTRDARAEIERLKARLAATVEDTEDLHDAQHVAAMSAAGTIAELRAEIEGLRALATMNDTARLAVDDVAQMRAEADRLAKIADAWKALAKAERADSGAARFGSQVARARAFADVQAARDALVALDIDPDAP